MRKRISKTRGVVGVVLLCVTLGLLAALSMGEIEPFQVPSESMVPTLQVGDRVLMWRAEGHMPKRGEVIVFQNPRGGGELLVKRAVALPNETFQVRGGAVLVNGEAVKEPWLTSENRRIEMPDTDPITVGAECVFVLGDNRNYSYDSIEFGCVPTSKIRGTLIFRYWPLDGMGTIE